MGRPRAVDDRQLLESLAAVFRAEGYEGASLASLASAAGLRSASLYHRFAGGKRGMALAVLDDVEQQFAQILEPLSTDPSPTEGVRETARRISTFYRGGRLACLLETMTLATTPPDVTTRADEMARAWISAMSHAATRSGADASEARRRGEEAFVRIEGALVLARVLGDPQAFVTTLTELPGLLTGAQEEA